MKRKDKRFLQTAYFIDLLTLMAVRDDINIDSQIILALLVISWILLGLYSFS